jgi:ribonuclease HI
MYRIQWLSESITWHTSHSVNSERSAIQAALRLAASGRYRAVRVISDSGAVLYSG